MTFEIGGVHEPNPVLQRALEILLILHADHEQNASTNAVRGVGSTQVDPFSAVSAGIAALYGPLHGGANEQVLRMLDEIGDVKNVPAFIEGVKNREKLLMGFGHRVYKNYDPRAKLIKRVADEVFAETGVDPKLEIALELERIALEDEFFVERKLYPNVDFYSGIIYRAMGYPDRLFHRCCSRSGGCPAGSRSGRRCSSDSEQKIARPRQIYTGYDERDFVPIASARAAQAGFAGAGDHLPFRCTCSYTHIGSGIGPTRHSPAGEVAMRRVLRCEGVVAAAPGRHGVALAVLAERRLGRIPVARPAGARSRTRPTRARAATSSR